MGTARFEITAEVLAQLLKLPIGTQVTCVKEIDHYDGLHVRTLSIFVESPEFDGLGGVLNPVLVCPHYTVDAIEHAKFVDWGIPKP